ncbi:MAG: CDP-diacylglycerol--serine O-phosphatidyltransferase [Bacteroidales bacterium]|nr:CDP-diacylglycerol--serine O-phosphatidyltransferase [Bacteroidales bacterium]
MSLKNHIPNTITSLNLLSGTFGIVAAMNGRLDLAFYLMLAGAVFDFCDGLSARALGAYSPMGKELDSLSDVVSFGVLPSMMFYATLTGLDAPKAVCFIPLVIAVFSGLRLAKFNIDERQSHSFIGLPTPACAMICGSLAYAIAMSDNAAFASWNGWTILLPVLSVVLSLLLVSEIPMFSMKFSKEDTKEVKNQRIVLLSFFCGSLSLVLGFDLNWALSITILFVLYILINLGSLPMDLKPKAGKNVKQ